MSEFEFTDAVREQTTVIIAVAGASGSGKTFTALQLALGLAGPNGRIAVVGTEGRRALHYAPPPGQEPDFVNTFPFKHMELREPYSPDRFLSAFKVAEAAGFSVIVADSFSDEYVGAGGLVDMKEAELAKMKNKNDAAAWARPKAAHKLVTRWMRTCKSHLIVCLRAEEKVKLEKIGGETKVIPIGWQPSCEKTVPYEMLTSIMLHPDQPGIPHPIKIEQQHRAFFPPDRPVTREVGRALAAWAAGGAPVQPEPGPPLGDRAFTASGFGMKSLEEFWRILSREDKLALQPHLAALKERATKADQNTFGLPPNAPDRPAGSPPSASVLPAADDAGCSTSPPGEPAPEHAAARDPQHTDRKEQTDELQRSAETAPPRKPIEPVKEDHNQTVTYQKLLESIGNIENADDITDWRVANMRVFNGLSLPYRNEIARALDEKAGLLAMGDGR